MTSNPLSPPFENRPPASDLRQVLVLARHELTRYLRGKRFIGVFITIVILGLLLFLFIIPGTIGGRFSGSTTEYLYITPLESDEYPEYASFANMYGGAFGSNIDAESLTLMMNGTEYPETEWSLIGNDRIILFKADLSPSYYVVEAYYEYAVDPIDIADSYLDYLGIVIVISVLFFGADSLVGEFQSRTAYLLLPTPLRREVIYFGKLMGGYMASLVMLGIFYGIITLTAYSSVGSIPHYLSLSFCFAALYMLASLSFALFISSISKGVTGALISSLLILLIVFPVVQSAMVGVEVKPWYILSFAGDASTYSLQYDDYPHDIIVADTVTEFYPNLGVSAIVLLAYALGLTILGMHVFRKRDMKS